MEKVKINADYTIKLPKKLWHSFEKGDEFIIAYMRDTLELKKIKKKNLLDRAAEIKDKEQLSPNDLNRIIYQTRKSR